MKNTLYPNRECDDCGNIYKSKNSYYNHKDLGVCQRTQLKKKEHKKDLKSSNVKDNDISNDSMITRFVKELGVKLASSLHLNNINEEKAIVRSQSQSLSHLQNEFSQTNGEKSDFPKNDDHYRSNSDSSKNVTDLNEQSRESDEVENESRESKESDVESEKSKELREGDDVEREESKELREDDDIKSEEKEKGILTKKTCEIGELNLPITLHGTWEKLLFDPNEIADILGISDIQKSVQDFGDQKMNECGFLNTKGLYKLIALSNESHASQFQDWMYDTIEEIKLTGENNMKKSYQQMLASKDQELQIKSKEIDVLKRTDEVNQRIKDREQIRYNLKNAPAQSIYIYEDNRGLHKIGKTKGEIAKRTNAQKTSLPELKLKGEYKCIKCQVIENVIHFVLKEHRVDKSHEFFDIDFEKADIVVRNIILFIDGYRRLDKDITSVCDLPLSSIQ